MSVSKSGSTRVETSKLVAICTEKLGLVVENKAGWFLAYREGQRNRRLLVHTGKKGTNCIELVGFESPDAIVHPCPPAKTMTQMLDCNLPAKVILKNFYKTARLLVASSKPEAKKDEAPASSPETKPEAPASSPTTDENLIDEAAAA